MSLVLKTIKKAEKVVNAGLIQKIDSENWLVQGSKTTYTLEDRNGVLYCPCIGYQMKKPVKDCYHCQAVRIFEGI